MSNAQPTANDPVDTPSVQTYRYVRASIVGSVLLLFVAVGVQIVADGGSVESSISAYYYGPVRSVFVGILVAMGLALVAIKGRSGLEEIALNLAGMLAPVAAVDDPQAAMVSTALADLITERESRLKQTSARLTNDSPLHAWNGELLGIDRLDFRWGVARRHILDCLEGKEGNHAQP